jgi:hypothetical protein
MQQPPTTTPTTATTTMNELALRFGVMQRRFVEFSEGLPELLRVWLSDQQAGVVEVSFDSLTDFIFSLQVSSPDAPLHWMKAIARCALEDQLSRLPHLQYVKAGSAVLFKNIPDLLSIEWPTYSRTCVVARLTEDAAALRRRNSVLEVRVLNLETKLSNATGLSRTFTKTVLSSTTAAAATTTTVEATHSFLLEKRFEAEDSIHLLMRVQSEFVGRKRVLDEMYKDQEKKHAESRRTDAKKSRSGMALITDEIVRLRAELEFLRGTPSPSSSTTTTTTAASVVSGVANNDSKIVPR